MNRERVAHLLVQLADAILEDAGPTQESTRPRRRVRPEASPREIDSATRARIRRMLLAKGYRDAR